jgi:signal peptidase II
MSGPVSGMAGGPPGAAAGSAGEGSGWLWLPLTAVVIVADQLSKAWIVQHFGLYERKRLLSVLDITLMYNTGAAFSFLSEASGWQRWLFVGLAALVGVGIVAWMGRLKGRSQALLCCSLALILAGAIGNVIDRLRLGHVVDFVHAHWNDAYFPAFNVADSAITVGAILLLLDAWRESRVGKRARS